MAAYSAYWLHSSPTPQPRRLCGRWRPASTAVARYCANVPAGEGTERSATRKPARELAGGWLSETSGAAGDAGNDDNLTTEVAIMGKRRAHGDGGLFARNK